MRGRYVVLVVLIVAVWWMHRRTPDAEAVAPPTSTPTTTLTKTTIAPRSFTAPTPRPELPPEPVRGVDRPLPVVSPNTIHGRVTAVTGEPLQHVSVVALSTTGAGGSSLTDEDGYYEIGHLPAGHYHVNYHLDDHLVVLDVPVDDDVPTESFAAIDLDESLPQINADIDGRGIEYPVIDEPVDIEQPVQLDEVNEHPQLQISIPEEMHYNDPEIDWD